MTIQRDTRALEFASVTFGAFGLRLRCDRPIPGLVASPESSPFDLDVVLNPEQLLPGSLRNAPRQLRYASATQDQRGTPTLTAWTLADGAFFHFQYGDGTEFLIDRRGTQIRGTWPAALTLEDATTYLLGPVLGFVLRLRGITCLHASAIDIDGRAIAMVGPPGAGKSTAAAVFATSGFGVMSDDVVAVIEEGDTFLAQPAYPRLGLWPESIAALFGSPDALPRQTATWDKCYLALGQDGYAFQSRPVPLCAIYVLEERDPHTRAPVVGALPARDGLTRLIANTYVNYLLDRDMRARDLDVLARLAVRVPLRRLVPQADPASMHSLRDAILDDVRSLS
ncbi:MAG: hypothetical protein LC753_04455 [Acidobacteria bacterium]|nr:hypothetical protein [Acidobacteriota bacterium]MCA1649551.1 hypothetical protein [Acidobacteriota bacterium]